MSCLQNGLQWEFFHRGKARKCMETFFFKHHALLCIADSNQFYRNKLSFSNKKHKAIFKKIFSRKLLDENTKIFTKIQFN